MAGVSHASLLLFVPLLPWLGDPGREVEICMHNLFMLAMCVPISSQSSVVVIGIFCRVFGMWIPFPFYSPDMVGGFGDWRPGVLPEYLTPLIIYLAV